MTKKKEVDKNIKKLQKLIVKENEANKEKLKDPKEKELPKDLNKLLKPALIDIVIPLYPNMKGIKTKKKDELIQLIKDATKEEKKEEKKEILHKINLLKKQQEIS